VVLVVLVALAKAAAVGMTVRCRQSIVIFSTCPRRMKSASENVNVNVVIPAHRRLQLHPVQQSGRPPRQRAITDVHLLLRQPPYSCVGLSRARRLPLPLLLLLLLLLLRRRQPVVVWT
jgi:hypothetical protein